MNLKKIAKLLKKINIIIINMNCIYCNKRLRPTKRVDFVNRDYHFSCKELELKYREKEQYNKFVEWLKERIKNNLQLS